MQIGAVAIGARAVGIAGPPTSGKSSLALALIDRGAGLVGDDCLTLEKREDGKGARLLAAPPPNIAGMIEIAGVGIVRMPIADPVPLALVLSLGRTGERLPERIERREWLGIAIPVLPFDPGHIAPAVRAEYALRRHGLVFD